MTLALTTNYNNPANFVFDAGDIEVDANGARLLLKFFPQQDFSEDFADDTGFSYNNALASISGSAQQIDQSPSDQSFAAKYVNANMTWSKIGGETAVLNGAPTIVGGKLVCSGVQGVKYNTTANLYQAGSLKFKYTPNYSGAPAANVDLVSIEQTSGAEGNRLVLTHSPAGDNFRLTLTDGNSNNIYVATVIGGSGLGLVAATEYEIELSWDGTGGILYLFLDGDLHGTLSPGAFTFVSELMSVTAGATTAIYNTADASFDDVTLFSAVQHTASYTPGYTLLDFRYAETALTLPVFTYNGPGLLRPASPPTSTETGTPRYIIQGKYWDGDSWENSDGSYAQATSKADIIANIATFPSTGLSTITVILVFGNSNALSTVSQVDFSVEGQGYETTNPSIRPTAFTLMDGILDFAASPEFPGPDTVKYIVERRSTLAGISSYFYWNGSAWVASNEDYTQSNTETEFNDNLASLDLTAGYYVRIVALLHSEDSFSTPELDSTVFTYDFVPVDLPEPNRVILYGRLRDPVMGPLTGTIVVEITSAFIHSGYLFPVSQVSVETDVNGDFEFDGDNKLVETESIGKTYKLSINYDSPIKENIVADVTIPDQESVDVVDLAGLLPA